MKAAFLNAAKLDYDNTLDFSSLNRLVTLTKYEESSETEILARAQGQDIVITKELVVGKNVLSQFPASVKLICEAGTGYNNIDIATATDKGIAVCNIPGYSTEAVAQLAITFILNLSASLPQQQHMVEQKDFSNFWEYLKVPHFELQGRTLGIIGAGAIGQETIKLARALGMEVLVYSRTVRDWQDPAIRSASLEDVLGQSDFISLHCPLTAETKHIINSERLKLMKASAYLINTSRGALVNEADLVQALQDGRLAGAALDVQDPEPPDPDSPLFKMANVIMTPHIGWRRVETRQRLLNLVADNIDSFIAGRPRNVVNK